MYLTLTTYYYINISHPFQPTHTHLCVLAAILPITRPPTSPLNNLNKLSRNHAIRLLTRMQSIKPQKAIRTRTCLTISSGGVAMAIITLNIEGSRGAVEVRGWIVIDVGDLEVCYV